MRVTNGICTTAVLALALAALAYNSGKLSSLNLATVKAQSPQTPPIPTVGAQSETSVVGRFLVTKKETDIASFRTPSLRNVLITAPYFHDGSQATLWDAMDHYNKGDGIQNPWLDSDMQPLALSESEIDDM